MVSIDRVVGTQLQHFNLGDERLNNRASASILQIGEVGPSQSFPNIFKDSAGLKSFYRLVNNKKSRPRKIHASFAKSFAQLVQTDEKIGSFDYFLLYQDTTYGKYHNKKGVQLGYLQLPTDNGVVIHNCVLTGPDYVPLGVAAQQFIVRDHSEYGKSEERKGRPFEEKESFKWVEGIEWASRMEQVTGKKIIQVGDSESDIVAAMRIARKIKQDFIIRCQQDRNIKEDGHGPKLKAHVKAQPVMGTLSLTLLDPKGEGHPAAFEVQVATVRLEDMPEYPVQVIYLAQKKLYEGQKELCTWYIITSLPVGCIDQAAKVTDIYTHRWRTMEDFHKCMKTGCGIEHRQFESPEALFNAIALLSITAIHLLRMRHLAQTEPDAPMCTILDKTQLAIAEHFCEKTLKPIDYKFCKKGTILAFVLMLARLGGHQGMKQKGKPGWQTIWKGWNYFHTIEIGVKMSKNFNAT